MLGETHCFWGDRAALETDEPGINEPEKIRILVCGNTGVGKSTLINRVFGLAPSNEVVSFFCNFELIQPNLIYRP
jgi:ribosome biogenesis GTPase A